MIVLNYSVNLGIAIVFIVRDPECKVTWLVFTND